MHGGPSRYMLNYTLSRLIIIYENRDVIKLWVDAVNIDNVHALRYCFSLHTLVFHHTFFLDITVFSYIESSSAQ